MSLLQDIKDDQVACRKSGDKIKAEPLTTLYSEAAMVGKNKGNRETTDEEVIQVVKKFIKNINDTLETVQLSEMRQYELEKEIDLYSRYLPKQLTKEDLESIISFIVGENKYSMPKDIGKVMKDLAEEYPGQYDGKIASEIAKAFKTG